MAAAAGPAAHAEPRCSDAVGAAPLVEGEPLAQPPRQLAIDRAVEDAVRRVALAKLPPLEPEDAAEALDAVLADESPYGFTTRYRILEDRGERRAVLSQDPGVEREYVVVVEVCVDADRVGQRLERAGLLEPAAAPTGGRGRLRVEVVGLDGYGSYAALRRALDRASGPRGAAPLVEIERGRAVFAVQTQRASGDWFDALVASAEPELQVEARLLGERRVQLEIDWQGGPPAPAAGAPAVDRTEPNMY